VRLFVFLSPISIIGMGFDLKFENLFSGNRKSECFLDSQNLHRVSRFPGEWKTAIIQTVQIPEPRFDGKHEIGQISWKQ